jgi:transposase-like protein
MSAYSLPQFEADFPDEDACLAALFNKRFSTMKWCPNCGCKARFYRVKNRRSYGCMDCRYQLYPTAGTIFHKSHIPLRRWFQVMHMFSISRNGVGAKEIERMLGVTYVTALRMAHQIRRLMDQGNTLLQGTVEADEAYIGGRRRSSNRYSNKTALLGAVERGGKVRVWVTDTASSARVTEFLGSTVRSGSTLNTDESKLYIRAQKTYNRISVEHGKYEFVRGDIYTNTMEGFWGIFKPYLNGTHRSVSKHYLQLYVDEAVWKYNHRKESLFPVLWEAAALRVLVKYRNVYAGS